MQVETFNPNQLITFTEGAIQHFKTTVANSDALGVKLSLTGGGCAGFAYQWDLVEDISGVDLQDWHTEYEGLKFWLDHNSKVYLIGSTVELKTGVAGTYIEIQSPKASSSCGCGESISFTI